MEYFSKYNKNKTMTTKGKINVDLPVPVAAHTDNGEDHATHWEGKGFRNNLIDIFEKLKHIDNNEYRAGESDGSYETDNEKLEDEFINFENFNVGPGVGKRTGGLAKGENSIGSSLNSSGVEKEGMAKSLHLVVPEMGHKSGSGSLDSSKGESEIDCGDSDDEGKGLSKVEYDANVTIPEEHTEDCKSSDRVASGRSGGDKGGKKNPSGKKAKKSVMERIAEEKGESVPAGGEGSSLVISAKKRVVPKRRLVSEYSKKLGKSAEPVEEGEGEKSVKKFKKNAKVEQREVSEKSPSRSSKKSRNAMVEQGEVSEKSPSRSSKKSKNAKVEPFLDFAAGLLPAELITKSLKKKKTKVSPQSDVEKSPSRSSKKSKKAKVEPFLDFAAGFLPAELIPKSPSKKKTKVAPDSDIEKSPRASSKKSMKKKTTVAPDSDIEKSPRASSRKSKK